MEKLYIYLFIILAFVAGAVVLFYRRAISPNQEEEFNFISSAGELVFGNESVVPAPREHVLYQDQSESILVTLVKRAPRMILTTIFIQLFLMLFTGYLSVKNIERLAMAGAAVTQGEYGLAISALYPIGKDAAEEQWRVLRGVHPELDRRGLYNFAYIGSKGNRGYAVMEHLYRTQDHDPELSPDNPAYDNVITGLTAAKGSDICQERYGAQLISKADWEMSRGHIFAAKNVEEYPTIPEWARDVSETDSDNYYVISKESGAWEWAIAEDVDHNDNGHYVDEDELSRAGIRCSINWIEDADENAENN